MTCGQLKPFLPPLPFDFLVIEVPALGAQKLGDHAVAIAAILLGEPNQFQPKRIIVTRRTLITHRRARNPRHRSSPALRNAELLAGVYDNNHMSRSNCSFVLNLAKIAKKRYIAIVNVILRNVLARKCLHQALLIRDTYDEEK